MIAVYIDELTPCLKDVATGDIVETEVLKVSRKSFKKNSIKEMVGMSIGNNCQMKTSFMH